MQMGPGGGGRGWAIPYFTLKSARQKTNNSGGGMAVGFPDFSKDKSLQKNKLVKIAAGESSPRMQNAKKNPD